MYKLLSTDAVGGR